MSLLQEIIDRNYEKLNILKEIVYNFKRKCVVDIHENISNYRVIDSNINNVTPLNNKTYLIGIKSNNCNVTLDLGGIILPIQNKEIFCCINIYCKMHHNFDILISVIDVDKDYSIELKYSDDTQFTNQKIHDSDKILLNLIQTYSMFGIKN